MDLMHSGRFDRFVLVSSDSDFARLASRLREQGLQVYGIGKANTPEAFRKACKRCIFAGCLRSKRRACVRGTGHCARLLCRISLAPCTVAVDSIVQMPRGEDDFVGSLTHEMRRP